MEWSEGKKTVQQVQACLFESLMGDVMGEDRTGRDWTGQDQMCGWNGWAAGIGQRDSGIT